FFFLTVPSTTVIYSLSLHDALPIYIHFLIVYLVGFLFCNIMCDIINNGHSHIIAAAIEYLFKGLANPVGNHLTVCPCIVSSCSQDRKSTRLNSSHVKISYAVFCLKK